MGLVEQLGYIGGQDEDLGGCCMPLVLDIDGRKIFVLYEMHTYREGNKIKARHSKVEYPSIDELLQEFARVKERLTVDKRAPWVETDRTCGYSISLEEFNDASARYFATVSR